MNSSHPSQRCRSVRGLTLKVLNFWSACMLYSTMCLTSVSVPAEASRLRCGTDLLADLIFVCGDRGIYLGKHNWSGYGPRPRGKGIVDHCCKPGGCDLQHLEMYCAPANPKDRRHTTADPRTLPPTTTPQLAVTQQQFEAVFQKRLLQHVGTPDSPERQIYRKKMQNPQRRAKLNRGSRKRIHAQEPSHSPLFTSQSPLPGTPQPS